MTDDLFGEHSANLSLTRTIRSQNFNSWDRLPFVTESTGKASTDVLPTAMTHNFVISNYASTWPRKADCVLDTSALVQSR